MSTTFSVVIRDGLESDFEACLGLDRTYTTDHVWQMSVFEEPGNWQISFKREALPRTVEAEYPADERRLRASLPDEHCFLAAAERAFAEDDFREAARLCHVIRAANDPVPKKDMDRIWELLGIATTQMGEWEEALGWLRKARPSWSMWAYSGSSTKRVCTSLSSAFTW